MVDNCWYRPSFVGSASNIPFFTPFEGRQMSRRRRASHRILKTTSADNSPSRIAKRDMMFNHCHGQRRTLRNSIREQSFHSALLKTIPDERPASSISFAQHSHTTCPRTRPSPTWQATAYQPSEMLTSPNYMTNDDFYTQQPVPNISNNQACLPMEFNHCRLDIANRNSIYVMESLSSDPPTTNYLISATGYDMPLADDIENRSTFPTGLSTPNIIPTQNYGSEPKTPLLVPERNEPGEELVGVGLYDEPEGLPCWDYSMDSYLSLDGDADSLISLKRPKGKGLKLEETFDPSIIQSLQDDDDSDDEDSRSKPDIEKDQGKGRDDYSQRANQGQDEIQTPEDTKPRIERIMQASHRPFEFPRHIQPNEPWVLSSQHHDPESSPVYHLDMAGRSFFFEDEQDSDLIIMKSNQHAMDFPPNMYLPSYCATGYGWV
ncbi:hypothetical protein AJ78_05022 [Emergomyces pasteurianus Ep9510]|uniref:Uncharacterized protein n=1 Tax=Emergomyces pasteurianus Ep9510 TaxID=1447872 RepID=A0A1J9QHJ0_9EURO|nr:hypothetical protein AJ78_05022 [Emergomyces pasteurianus Ep9510]